MKDVIATIRKAISLAKKLQSENFHSEIMVYIPSSSDADEKVTIRIGASNYRDHKVIAKIHEICGVDFHKNQTSSNRASYHGRKQGFGILIRTNLPFCPGAPLCQLKTSRIKTFYDCNGIKTK